nr:hypothetical protein [Kibdelosporangium sp. MJ126-NF4]
MGSTWVGQSLCARRLVWNRLSARNETGAEMAIGAGDVAVGMR